MTTFKQMKQATQKGFIPAYSDYTKRAKMSEVMLAASSCRVNVSEYLQSTGSPASSSTAWGCVANPSKYVASMTVAPTTGIITVTVQNIGAPLDTDTFNLSPSSTVGSQTDLVSTDSVIAQWTCSMTTASNDKFLPSSCKL